MNIDEHIDMWLTAIENKDYKESDRIRDLLDTRGIFCYSTPDGPMILHRNKGTREDVINEIRAEKRFDAWLASVRSSNDYKRLTR